MERKHQLKLISKLAQRTNSSALFLEVFISLILFLNSLPLTAQSRVDIGVNRNVELIMSMQVLTEMDSFLLSNGFSGFPLTTRLNFPLKNEYLATFSPYKKSGPVQHFNAMIPEGFIFGRPLTTAVLSNSDLQLTNTCWIDDLPSPPYPADYKYAVEGFLEQARRFKEMCDFEAFFDARRPTYDSLVQAQQMKITLESLVSDMERFFGRELPGYHVVLVPLMWPGGMSLSAREPCNANYGETWILIGPKHVVNGLPDFGTVDEYCSVVVHEFCHAFIAPLCDRYKEQIMQYEALYASEQKVFRSNAIPGWFDACNELLTRAAEILVTSGGDPVRTESKLLVQSEDLGFRYLPVLVHAIEEHCLQQGKGFEEAFPDIIAAFGGINAIPL